jgi:hypothetical protein
MDEEKRLRIYIALVESVDIVNKWTTVTDDYRGSLYERTARLKDSLGFKEMQHWLEGIKK